MTRSLLPVTRLGIDVVVASFSHLDEVADALPERDDGLVDVVAGHDKDAGGPGDGAHGPRP